MSGWKTFQIVCFILNLICDDAVPNGCSIRSYRWSIFYSYGQVIKGMYLPRVLFIIQFESNEGNKGNDSAIIYLYNSVLVIYDSKQEYDNN